MKIRTITVGVVLKPEDFLCGSESPSSVFNTLLRTSEHLNAIEQALSIATSHEVQTLRVHTNSFEDWLLPLFQSPHNMTLSDAVGILERALNAAKISMCSIGPCESSEGIELAPHILALCDKLSCSVLFRKESNDDICPSYNKCLLAARSCLKLHQQCGDLGNFRFCASFHCPEGIPFFPAAYRIQRGSFSDTQPLLTIGLENGDLLFLAFHGTQSTYNTGSLNGTTEMDNIGSRRNPHAQGRDNLRDMMQQICLPIQEVVVKVCEERGVIYGGTVGHTDLLFN